MFLLGGVLARYLSLNINFCIRTKTKSCPHLVLYNLTNVCVYVLCTLLMCAELANANTTIPYAYMYNMVSNK